MTVDQFCSDIKSSIRAVSSDSYIPSRYIFSEAKSIIADFIKKDQDAKLKLTRTMSGWTPIDCVDLEELPVVQCQDIDVRLCAKLMKSVNPLPAIYSSSTGNIIKYVSSPNLSIFFDPTNPRQWNNIQKQRYKDKTKYYYYIIDNYLYFPIPKNIDLPIESVRMEAYFIDKWEVDNFKALKDCKDCKEINNCQSPLDYELVIPPYLLNDVKKELLNRLLSTYLKLSLDEYPNLSVNDKTNERDKGYLDVLH